MLANPRRAAKRMARLAGVWLSRAQLGKVAERSSLAWSIKHVDPYNGRAVTPFSPPEQPGVSASNFILNVSRMPAWAQPLHAAHKAHIRGVVHAEMVARTHGRGKAAGHARALLSTHRRYFCGVDGVPC